MSTDRSSKRGGWRLPRVDDALLQQMVEVIVEAADPEQVILYGSRARGDARADSDVDLLVLEAEPFGPDRSRFDEVLRLRRALFDFPVPKDVLVYSVEEADFWRGYLNHVLGRALQEGIVLYERD